MRAFLTITCLLIACAISVPFAQHSTRTAPHRASPAGSPQPSDAEKVRAEIRAVEDVLPGIPDRGAALFLLARRYAHLGDLQKALSLLEECMALNAGFDPEPGESPSLRPLMSDQ